MAYVRWLGRDCSRMKPGANFPESVTRELYQELKKGEIIEVPDDDAKIIGEWIGMEVVVKPKVKKEKLGKVKEKVVIDSFEAEKPAEVFKKDD